MDTVDNELAYDILEKICRLLTEKMQPVPQFPTGDVPLDVAARVYGKDKTWIRAGIIDGWLPIGRATRQGKLVTDLKYMDSKYGRIAYHISPKKLWEDTGYAWKGEKE